MNTADSGASRVVLAFGEHRPGRALGDLPAQRIDTHAEIDSAIGAYRRVVAVGTDADLAALLSRLLRAGRLDVEVAYVPRRRTAATRVYRLPAGRRAARRALHGSAHRVPLIRDDTGSVVVGRARWLPPDDGTLLHGEATVDDTQLFDGDVVGVDIEPTLTAPGLRARVAQRRWRGWIAGRAAQLGSTGVAVVRDGVPVPRVMRRSTFYRNVEGWLLVR
ncbi:MAG: peptidase M50 [Mycobacterium sp.]|nr:peptidase M50 [Mycobacterium sp.]